MDSNRNIYLKFDYIKLIMGSKGTKTLNGQIRKASTGGWKKENIFRKNKQRRDRSF